MEQQRPIQGKPIQLVFENEGNLVLNEEAVQKIYSLKGSLGVVAVIGPYRTGKSYIMNRLFNRSDGFKLGGTTNSCTKGIWMWDNIIKHTNEAGEQMNLIILDTEGLGSPDTNSEWDTKIFILTLLINSLLIYNTMRVIDRDAINKLGFITKLASHVRRDRSVNEEDNQTYLSNECPDFIWVLRDWTLTLPRPSMTKREYLLENLELEIERNNEDEQSLKYRNYIKKSIKSYFRSLDCITLVVPVSENDEISLEEMLQKLDEIPYGQSRPKFKKQMDELCKKIKSKVSLKKFNSTTTTGASFIETVRNFISCLNNNETIYVGESHTAAIRLIANNALNEAEGHYNQLFDEFFVQNELPIPRETFEHRESDIYNQCLQKLRNAIIGSDEITTEFETKLQTFRKNSQYKIRNEEAFDSRNRLIGGVTAGAVAGVAVGAGALYAVGTEAVGTAVVSSVKAAGSAVASRVKAFGTVVASNPDAFRAALLVATQHFNAANFDSNREGFRSSFFAGAQAFFTAFASSSQDDDAASVQDDDSAAV